MKRVNLCCYALALLCLIVAPVFGQTEPQYTGQYNWIGANGQLVSLEAAPSKVETHTKNRFISNTVSTSITVPGAASAVRLGPRAHFVVRLPAGMDSVDPNTQITLRAFTIEGDKRSLPMATGSAGMFQGAKSGTASIPTVPLSFKKYGPSSLEIIPQQPLAPGEYLLGLANPGQPVAAFGVDANGPASASAPAPTAPQPPSVPSFVKWSASLASPITKDVKAACESPAASDQAYCFGVLTAIYDSGMAQSDAQTPSVNGCMPLDTTTAAQLRDAFLAETRRQPDQLLGPVITIYSLAVEHGFSCPATPPKKRTTRRGK